jgi:H+/gluconate symporter-like permease
MKTAIKVALAALMGCGALLLVLGIVIWTGHGDQLIRVHIVFGIVLVLSLWTIAAIAARAGVASGTVAFAAAWGLLVVILGLAQEELVPDGWHWTIQVLHLVISMGAIWWGRRLVRLIGQAQQPVGGPRPVAGPQAITSRTGST